MKSFSVLCIAVAAGNLVALVNANVFEHYIPPWDKESLRTTLAKCRLQEPESSPASVSSGAFEDYATAKFRLDPEKNNTLHLYQVRDEGKRNELRVNEYFKASDNVVIEADMELPYPDQFNKDNEDGNRHFTIFQSHVKNYLGYNRGPLLTFRYYTSRNNIFGNLTTDHIWANVRNELSTEIKSNTVWDAGPRPDGPFTIKIEFKNSMLSIQINGREIDYFPRDLTYWNPIEQNYFKSGIYLTGWNTTVNVTFDEIYMGREDHRNRTWEEVRENLGGSAGTGGGGGNEPEVQKDGVFRLKLNGNGNCHVDEDTNCIVEDPGDYAPQALCTWFLDDAPVVLRVETFDIKGELNSAGTGATGDYLTVRDYIADTDIDYFGPNITDGPHGLIVNAGTKFSFRANGNPEVGSGLRICAVQIPKTGTFRQKFNPNGNCQVDSDGCILPMAEGLGNYADNEVCTWYLDDNAATMEVVDYFDLVGPSDKLTIQDTVAGTTIDYYGPNITDGPHGAYVNAGAKFTFRSNGAANGAGFKICPVFQLANLPDATPAPTAAPTEALPIVTCPNATGTGVGTWREKYNSGGCIIDGNCIMEQEGLYDNGIICSWILDDASATLCFEEYDLEDGGDKVEIVEPGAAKEAFTGPADMNSNPLVNRTIPASTTVKFRSNGSGNARGVKICAV